MSEAAFKRPAGEGAGVLERVLDAVFGDLGSNGQFDLSQVI